MKAKLLAALVLAGALLAVGLRFSGARGAPVGAEPAQRALPPASPAQDPGPAPQSQTAGAGLLADLGDPALSAEVLRVIDSMQRTGRPPEGVVQGGRRNGPRGVFDNAQGRLPRRGAGYYRESDVWPHGSEGRGAQRLIFGRDGEVYFTADHYRSFTRVQ
jgi:guanyl-specific ribonuclease Sa